MKYPVYCVRDLKVEFLSPMIYMNEAAAKRDFAYRINTGDTMYSFAPADYELYQIGTFDSEKGIIESFQIPEFISRGTDMVGTYYEK